MKPNHLHHTNKQAFADLLKASYQNLNEDHLRDMAYIAYITSELGKHQQALCQDIYPQLMNWEFKINAKNRDVFTQQFAELVDITIENLRIINYGTLVQPYYRNAFFSALHDILATTDDAISVRSGLVAQFHRGWETLPQKENPLAFDTTQQFADTLQKNYQDYRFRSDADRQALMESWKKLVRSGKRFYQRETHYQPKEYNIHYQAFSRYIDDPYYNLAALTYSIAKMLQLATLNLAEAKYSADFCPFLSGIHGALGYKVADAFGDQAILQSLQQKAA